MDRLHITNLMLGNRCHDRLLFEVLGCDYQRSVKCLPVASQKVQTRKVEESDGPCVAAKFIAASDQGTLGSTSQKSIPDRPDDKTITRVSIVLIMATILATGLGVAAAAFLVCQSIDLSATMLI